MSALLSTAVLGLAWFTAANAVLSLVSSLAASVLSLDVSASPRRARRLLALRLFPAAGAAIVSTVLFIPAHLWLEPANTAERIGLLPITCAAVGLLLIAVSGCRVARVGLSSVQLTSLRAVPTTAAGQTPWLEMPMFQGIALAGIVWPRILVGSSVRRILTPSELDTAIAHELAHAHAGDNFARALMECVPDFFRFTRAAHRVEQLWEAEVECLADARATRGDPMQAACLASALLKVTRLAGRKSQPLCSRAWSSFHHPLLLETRVRLLISNPVAAVASTQPLPWIGGWVALIVGATWVTGLPFRLHSLTEVLISAGF